MQCRMPTHPRDQRRRSHGHRSMGGVVLARVGGVALVGALRVASWVVVLLAGNVALGRLTRALSAQSHDVLQLALPLHYINPARDSFEHMTLRREKVKRFAARIALVALILTLLDAPLVVADLPLEFKGIRMGTHITDADPPVIGRPDARVSCGSLLEGGATVCTDGGGWMIGDIAIGVVIIIEDYRIDALGITFNPDWSGRGVLRLHWQVSPSSEVEKARVSVAAPRWRHHCDALRRGERQQVPRLARQ